MAIRDVFKVNRRTFLNPGAWLGFSEVKGNTRTIVGYLRELVAPPPDVTPETFDEAMLRLKVSEENIKENEKNYFLYAMIFVAAAALTILISFAHLFVYHTVAGFLIGLAVAMLFLTQAFRFHFWYFEIKTRTLGQTYKDWRDWTFKTK